MHTKEVKVVNPTGLHARPAAEFYKKAIEFRAKITIKKLGNDPKEGNAKSLIGIMAAGIGLGDTVQIIAEGDDEMIAVETLAAVISSGFGEI